MRELLIATTNAHKGEEIAHALEGLPFRILTLKDVDLDALDVEETEPTLEGNAILKARTYATRSGKLTLADDTGIFVDALNGRPGVKSARYAPTPEERNQKLLDEMKDVPDGKRSARFMVTLAIFDPAGGKVRTCEDSLEGEILREERPGRNFNYDLLFYIPAVGKSYSELSIEEKNRISHRGKALVKARDILIAEFE